MILVFLFSLCLLIVSAVFALRFLSHLSEEQRSRHYLQVEEIHRRYLAQTRRNVINRRAGGQSLPATPDWAGTASQKTRALFREQARENQEGAKMMSDEPFRNDEPCTADGSADEKPQWQTPKIEYVGEVAEVIQGGGGKVTVAGGDPGDPRKPQGQG